MKHLVIPLLILILVIAAIMADGGDRCLSSDAGTDTCVGCGEDCQ